jgi:hypothetical protein
MLFYSKICGGVGNPLILDEKHGEQVTSVTGRILRARQSTLLREPVQGFPCQAI